MQLEQMTANVRYRTPWEGVDLGFVAARRWFLPLWGLWWLTALPVTLLAVLLLHRSPLLTALAVWWCKPLYEPLLLYWLSRRLFGETLPARALARRWRAALLPGLGANLTVWRLGPNRSFHLPVALLERLTGAERRKRLTVLGGGQSAGLWLSVVAAHFEAVFTLGALLLLLYLVPDRLQPQTFWSLGAGGSTVLAWLGDGFWLLAMSAVAPFYVAGGFALYLSRRSQLEAWELELSFRRMAPRFRAARAGAAAAALAACVLLQPAGGARAATPPAAAPAVAVDRATAAAAIKRVLADPAFGKEHTEHYWKYVGPRRQAQKAHPAVSLAWLAGLADLLKYLLWVVAVVVAGWLLLNVVQLAEWLSRRRRPRAEPPATTLFGLPITPESLPRDVAGAIRGMVGSGELRAALGLLYRATLMRLVHDHHLRIPQSATEGECQRLVQGQRPAAEAALFAQLTGLWTRCAYGHLMPPADDILRLTETWRDHYAGGGDE